VLFLLVLLGLRAVPPQVLVSRSARDTPPARRSKEVTVFDELTDELLELRVDVRGYGAAVYARNEDEGGGYCSCCCCCWGF